MTLLLRIVLVATLAVFAWYLFADRLTPFTSNARVKAIVTPVIPQVSGPVTEVAASNAVLVEAGTVLARIDPRRFEIARARAQADLEAATQAVGVSSAEVERAQAQLVRARADLENVQLQTGRVLELESKGLVPVAQADDARTALSDAKAVVEVAEADLERARLNLGQEGADNPRVRAALADLAQAELDLSYTELLAPARGAVVGLSIAEGAQAKAGQPLMTFVDVRDIWIEAYLTENNIGELSLGDPVDVVLDMHPGRILTGEVQSITAAAATGDRTASGGLPATPGASGWLRDPQRFPVWIILPDYLHGNEDDDVLFAMNGQADVIVYAGDNVLLNALGAAYIRAVSWLSYAY
ncbi:MAG: HlyD family secretion protein [Pseudomonadota bacterium]